MGNYLIEFRFQSKRIRTYLKGMIYEINRRFGVGKRKHIPHITLVGPIITNNEGRLISDFARVCSQTKVMKFKGEGFGTFDNNRVVFVDIGATDKLNEFRINLVEALRPYCKLQSQDKKKEKDRFKYHSTLAMKLNQSEFDSIKTYIRNKPAPEFKQIVMRITLLKGGKILREYDFMQKRLLKRRQALNKMILRNSKELLRRFIEGKYDPNERLKQAIEYKQPTLWDKIKSFFGIR
ncbi:hypothetical protein COV19_02665 [Candidatus Woesearchaeota archaeon CG10_big_fil_rev_8_21_14_0_10_44_13]|nr:MAG: hypothetical protein COV19_02665 [Candidatus Woesearchaeota archaeon CG10_big_fil_rev_8_21_14_0_10_44_13]